MKDLNWRRKRLGISYAILGLMTGIHPVTLQRILTGRHGKARFSNVLAIAEALGIRFTVDKRAGIEEMRERQAKKKAKHIVKMVQGSAGLESQAVSPAAREEMIRRTVHELLAGPNLRLWSEP